MLISLANFTVSRCQRCQCKKTHTVLLTCGGRPRPCYNVMVGPAGRQQLREKVPCHLLSRAFQGPSNQREPRPIKSKGIMKRAKRVRLVRAAIPSCHSRPPNPPDLIFDVSFFEALVAVS